MPAGLQCCSYVPAYDNLLACRLHSMFWTDEPGDQEQTKDYRNLNYVTKYQIIFENKTCKETGNTLAKECIPYKHPYNKHACFYRNRHSTPHHLSY